MRIAVVYHPKFLEAVELFNRGEFWESHEALEIPWKADPTPAREFYQGLIHCAATLHHLRLATTRREGRRGDRPATEAQMLRHIEGAKGQWEKGRRRLERFRPMHHGMDVGKFLDEMGSAVEGLEDGNAVFRQEAVPWIILDG